MAINSTTEPASVTAGDTVTWSKSLPNYPASAGWVLAYTLINASAKIVIESIAEGDAHRVEAAALVTAAWAAGDYTLHGVVSKAGQRFTVFSGAISIRPDISAATTLDARSPAKKMLEALEAAYTNYISIGQAHVAEYEIAGRRMKFRQAGEIWQQIEKLRREVAAEDRAARIAAGLSGRRRVLIRFGS